MLTQEIVFVATKAIDVGALTGKPDFLRDGGFQEEVKMLSKFRHLFGTCGAEEWHPWLHMSCLPANWAAPCHDFIKVPTPE
mmetsp:Transcript_78977/g.183218  ORF Transcript_78977/g.183218 Transcript_78977/m.183218 type:complete len:81 (+) Transcript_78977:282-524(+)